MSMMQIVPRRQDRWIQTASLFRTWESLAGRPNTRAAELSAWLSRFRIAAVVPAYRVEREIEHVLCSLPEFISHIIVVCDASPDRTAEVVERVARRDARVILIQHAVNQGVGGAMVTGFRKALELQAQIVVKIDGDGQMDPEDLPRLLLPLVYGEADYTKGNRFHDFHALRRMPGLRRTGNLVLSFMSKAATGYWNCFDPNNGYVAIRGDALEQLPLERIDRSYFFENSMLSQLYLLDATVREIPMSARYANETSSLSILRVLAEFPWRLLVCLVQRVVLKGFIYNFSLESVYLLCGLPMLLAGAIYGGVNWLHYFQMGTGAPTGTVVISAMLILLGFQILLAAVVADLQAVPQVPLCVGMLCEAEGPPGEEEGTESRLRQRIDLAGRSTAGSG